MDWRIKAFTQRIISNLPESENINYFLQRRFGALRNFENECKEKINDWEIMASNLIKAGGSFSGKTFFEIGTGWFSCFPICLFLSDAKKIITVDVINHLKHKLTFNFIRQIGERLKEIADICGNDLTIIKNSYNMLLEEAASNGKLSGLLKKACIEYLTPVNAAQTNIESNSIDIVFSNDVLEHVPSSLIPGIITEAKRVLKKNGLMYHSIGCNDHYYFFDKSITPLNYLRYSKEQWKKWNNNLLYQNRLRAIDFIRMTEKAGFEIILNTAIPKEQNLAWLKQIPVADCFKKYSTEELCITSVDFLAKPL